MRSSLKHRCALDYSLSSPTCFSWIFGLELGDIMKLMSFTAVPTSNPFLYITVCCIWETLQKSETSQEVPILLFGGGATWSRKTTNFWVQISSEPPTRPALSLWQGQGGRWQVTAIRIVLVLLEVFCMLHTSIIGCLNCCTKQKWKTFPQKVQRH